MRGSSPGLARQCSRVPQPSRTVACDKLRAGLCWSGLWHEFRGVLKPCLDPALLVFCLLDGGFDQACPRLCPAVSAVSAHFFLVARTSERCRPGALTCTVLASEQTLLSKQQGALSSHVPLSRGGSISAPQTTEPCSERGCIPGQCARQAGRADNAGERLGQCEVQAPPVHGLRLTLVFIFKDVVAEAKHVVVTMALGCGHWKPG